MPSTRTGSNFQPASIARVDAVYAGHARRVERLLARHSAAKMVVVLCFLGELADELKTTAAQFTEEHATQLEAGAMRQ